MLGVAVSGGPDSLALLLLAHAAMPGRVAAATVDHGLRPESAGEAQFVAGLCRELGVPHSTLNVTVGEGNLQDNARKARYQALLNWLPRKGDGLIHGSGWGPSALATAHHADDQAETLLMRLNRGSGLAGLAGIRGATVFPPYSHPVVRPLLSWRRAELADIVERAGIAAVSDPSNANRDFERVRVREALREADWIDVVGLARSVAHLQQVETTLDFVIEEEFDACTEEGENHAYRPYERGRLHREPIWMGVLGLMAMHMGRSLTSDQSARIVESLQRGEKVNIARVQAWSEERGGQVTWYLGPESLRRTG
jgi:tRNA(Ile)-lysidine synthase